MWDNCFVFQYTSIEKESESYMSYEDFVRRFLGLLTEDNYNPDTVKRLANCLDTNKNGYDWFIVWNLQFYF